MVFPCEIGKRKSPTWHWLLLASVVLMNGLIVGIPFSIAQEIRMELKEHFVLGTSEEDSIDMFGNPVVIRSDNSGNIYVFDQLSMRIKVFDSNGHVLRSLGGRGNEPGEFYSISTGWVTPRGRVILYDQFNTRITTISPRGEIDVIDTSPDSILWLRDLVPYGGDYYGLYRIPSSSSLVHHWDSTFSTLQGQFADFEDWPFSNTSFMDALTYFDAGRIIVWREQLVMAPPVCDGNLLAYDLNLATPGLNYRLRGTSPNSPLIVDVNESEIDRIPATVVLNYSGKKYTALVNCWSVGLKVIGDDVLAHFSVRQKGRRKIIFVDLFDKNGIFIGGHSLDELEDPTNEDPFAPISIFPGLDDRLFVIDHRGSVPLVRVMSIELLHDS